MKTKNTIIYTRESTKNGMHSMHQLDACCQYCTAQGLTENLLIYRIGTSDTSELINKIQEMIKRTDESARPSELVTYDLTRISRDATECRKFCTTLEELGITLHLATGIDNLVHRAKKSQRTKQTRKSVTRKKRSSNKGNASLNGTKNSTNTTSKERIDSKTKAK